MTLPNIALGHLTAASLLRSTVAGIRTRGVRCTVSVRDRGSARILHPTSRIMSHLSFIRIVTALGVVALAAPTFATEQARDTVTFAGQQHMMLERPLNDFLRRLPAIPRFDIPSTANYKGYTTGWQVTDSRFYLTSFSATTNRQPYSVTLLFPDRRLPILADWYSGTIHIVSGRETLANGYRTYERVTAFRVTNGVLTATNEMRNVREDKLKQ